MSTPGNTTVQIGRDTRQRIDQLAARMAADWGLPVGAVPVDRVIREALDRLERADAIAEEAGDR